jgi:hypothetical protein
MEERVPLRFREKDVLKKTRRIWRLPLFVFFPLFLFFLFLFEDHRFTS